MGKSGLLSSAAAAIFLTLASGCLLLIASSVVAFRGWPSLREAEPPAHRVTLAPPAGQLAATPTPQTVTLARPQRRSTRTARDGRAGTAVARASAASVQPLKTRVRRRSRRTATEARGPVPKIRVRGVAFAGGPTATPAPGAPAPTATADPAKPPVQQVVDEVERVVDGLAGRDGLVPLLP